MEKVIFRKFKSGDIVALFPEILNGEPWKLDNILSYQRIGQHGSAHYSHCLKITTPAKPQEYSALKQELESIGYKIEPKQKRIFKKR